MLKYTLRIEGTAEEIAYNKDVETRYYLQATEQCGEFQEVTSVRHAVPFVKEYITREPKIASSQCEHCGQQLPKEVLRYRIKSLVELVQEFGEDVKIVGKLSVDEPEIHVKGQYATITQLGADFEGLVCMDCSWDKVFLKQID